MAYEINEQQKIGLGLIGFGIFFTFLAIILFFDRGLLALGNILWLTGVTLCLVCNPLGSSLLTEQTIRVLFAFFLDSFSYLFVGLFGFWPSVKVFLYQIPVVGWILQYPLMILDRLKSG